MSVDPGVNVITHRVIGAAMEVHRELGPGLMESAYQAAMAIALEEVGLSFVTQKKVPAYFHGRELDVHYRIDLLVEGQVIVELKAVKRLEPIFTAQLLTYLKLTSCQIGLLINFHVPLLKQGIKRIINNIDLSPPPRHPPTP